MEREAICSIRHESIGRSTDKPGTAGAHARYFMETAREREVSFVFGTEVDPAGWGLEYERSLRANARIADKVMVAIPLAIPADARAELITDFIAAYVGPENIDRVKWSAAIHAEGEDRENPHCHMLISQRDRVTGKRLVNLTDAKTTERLRACWESTVNFAFADHGVDEFIDHRSFARRGIERVPTKHVGPRLGRQSRDAIEHNELARAANNVARLEAQIDRDRRELERDQAEMATAARALAPPIADAPAAADEDTTASVARPVEDNPAVKGSGFAPPAMPAPLTREVIRPDEQATQTGETTGGRAAPEVGQTGALPQTPEPGSAPGGRLDPLDPRVVDVVRSLARLGGDPRFDPALAELTNAAINNFRRARAASLESGHGNIGEIPIHALPVRNIKRRLAAVADRERDLTIRVREMIQLVSTITFEAKKLARETYRNIIQATKKRAPLDRDDIPPR